MRPTSFSLSIARHEHRNLLVLTQTESHFDACKSKLPEQRRSVSPRTPQNKKDFENHRTATEYEDSLVAKLFCFTFCNSYGGFVYLAFIGEPVVGVECEKSCMSLLATNLTIVFVVQLLVGLVE